MPGRPVVGKFPCVWGGGGKRAIDLLNDFLDAPSFQICLLSYCFS